MSTPESIPSSLILTDDDEKIDGFDPLALSHAVFGGGVAGADKAGYDARRHASRSNRERCSNLAQRRMGRLHRLSCGGKWR